MTTVEFLKAYPVRFRATPTDRNATMADPDWAADHWRCALALNRRRMVTPFSKGVGHHGAPPTAAEVLDCLAMDAAGVENARDFADWCAAYGYDADSRKAERIYRACERSAASLRRLLGDDAYATLLWKTERE